MPSLLDFPISHKVYMDTNAKKSTKAPKCIGCGYTLCAVHDVCEWPECKLYSHKILTSDDLKTVRHLMADSQKVRGFNALCTNANTGSLQFPRPYFVIIDESDIEGLGKQLEKTQYRWLSGFLNDVFVRPCPHIPRHGFVESRSVEYIGRSDTAFEEDVRTIFREARAADPKAELLIMPKIDATHSITLVPTRFAIGLGHDGSTSGRGTVDIPLMGVPFYEINPDLLFAAGVDTSKYDPYIEAVVARKNTNAYDYSKAYVVQLRAGEKVPASRDYIPSKIRVTSIIEASGDLLEWEKQVKSITEGTVVAHKGGTLISHYGVHCMVNKIPCLTSYVPEVGEILIPTDPIPDPNPHAVIRGLALGAKGVIIKHRDWREIDKQISTDMAALMIMTTLHNAKAMSGEHGIWIGVAASFMMRIGMAASHGEARHARGKDISREQVYGLALDDFFTSRSLLGHAQDRFKNFKWSGSFGGKKWAECTDSIMKLDQAIRTLLTDPTIENVNAIITHLNVAVNMAHNGGWWLDKFISQGAFTEASRQSLSTLILAAPGYYTVAQVNQEFDPLPVIEEWKAAPEIEILYSTWLGQDPNVKEPKYSNMAQIKDALENAGVTTPYDDDDDPDEEDDPTSSDPDDDTCGNPDCHICGKNKPVEESTF